MLLRCLMDSPNTSSTKVIPGGKEVNLQSSFIFRHYTGRIFALTDFLIYSQNYYFYPKNPRCKTQ